MLQFFHSFASHRAPIGLILLNTPLAKSVLSPLWDLSSYRVCADGAANRLAASDPLLIPDLIVGDLDSVSEETLSRYSSIGVTVSNMSHDQDSTDLDKALRMVSSEKISRAVVVGQFMSASRLDHFFGVLQSAYRGIQSGDFNEIVCFSDQSVMQVLPAGEHILQTQPGLPCGLIPSFGPVEKVSTKGLKWDLADQPMQFGGLISTSNIAMGQQITVSCSQPLVWTMSWPSSGD